MTTQNQKGNAHALADFIESGKHHWDISLCETCFFGQYRDLRAGNDWGNLAEFLNLSGNVTVPPGDQMGDLTMPPGYNDPGSNDVYSRRAAVRVLRHLAETGEVRW